MITNFLILNLINFICDYPLQHFFLAEWKQKNNYVLFVHCYIWAGGLALGLFYLNIFAWWKVILLFVGHFAIDYWKCRGIYKKWSITDVFSFYIDQVLHLIQIGVCL